MSDKDWEDLVKQVQKMPKTNRVVLQKTIELKVTPKITLNQVYQGESLDTLEIGNCDNIDANTVKRFKKGEFRIEAELDLHGYTEDEAFEAVTGFVKNSYLRGRRCIVIITGKGLHQSEIDDIFAARGVLKERVPQWLNMPDIRPLILAMFHPEHQKGGSGAIRILLRRHRR